MDHRHPQDWGAARAAAEDIASAWAADAPGGAIVGFDRGGIRFAVAGGLESLSTGRPFTPDSIGRYASVTKHVFCAMVLSNPDAVSLEAPLAQYLPELTPALGQVRVAQALSMAGGIPDTRECLALHGLTTPSRTEAAPLLAYMARLPHLNFAAGSMISYSNGGYRLVEAALERRGLRFADFVRDRISRPQGLRWHAPETWDEPVPGLIPGHVTEAGGWREGAQGMHLSAAGSLNGSAMDLARWVQAGMSGHQAALSAPRRLGDGRMTGYGLGIRWSDVQGLRLAGHGGSQPGFRSYFLTDPATGTGVALLANREDTDSHEGARHIMALLHGLSVPPRVTPGWAPEGFYLSDDARIWAEVRPRSIVILGAEEALWDAGEGRVRSASASAPVLLHWTGEALEGEIGHAACRLRRVAPDPVQDAPDGLWTARDEGAFFEIRHGVLSWGTAAQRQESPLMPLGGACWLFTLNDGPTRKSVLLRQTARDDLDLSTDRARRIGYRRLRV